MSDDAVFDAAAFVRPARSLLTYYCLVSFLWGPLFPVIFTIRWIRYATLRYRIEPTRISASWGRLAHREVSLGYERVQDIQLRRNILERQLGLARLEIQTASGDAKAEIAIEGAEEYEALRAYLIRRVKAVKNEEEEAPTEPEPESEDELVTVLREVASELRTIRSLLAERTESPSTEEDAAEPAGVVEEEA